MATSWGLCRAPHIPILGSQHIVPHWAPVSAQTRANWALMRAQNGCSRMGEGNERGTHACTNWAPMPELDGHSCKLGDRARTDWALVHELFGCF